MRRYFLALASGLFLAACSNHPVIQDTTGYPTSAVVNKVRCEVLDELRRYIDYERIEVLHQRFEEYELNKRAIKDPSPKVKEFKTAFEANEAETKEVVGKIAALKQQEQAQAKDKAQFEARVAALLEAVKALIKEAEGVAENDRVGLLRLLAKVNRLQPEAKDLVQENERLIAKDRELAAAPKLLAERLDELTKAKEALTKKPGFDEYQQYRDIADSVAAATKELRRSNSPFAKYYAFTTTNMAMQFRFQITEDDNGSAEGSIVWPVALGSITLGYSAGKEKKRFSERTVAVSEDFSDLLRIRLCDDYYLTDSPRARIYPVTGNIGMAELVEQFLQINHDVKLVKEKKIFSEKLQFTTTLKGGLKPSLMLSPSTGHTVRFNGNFDADRIDLHEVIIDILPGTELVEAPSEIKSTETKMNIVKVPDLRIRLSRDGEWQTSVISAAQ